MLYVLYDHPQYFAKELHSQTDVDDDHIYIYSIYHILSHAVYTSAYYLYLHPMYVAKLC